MDPWVPKVLQEVPGTHRVVPGGFRVVPWDPKGGPRIIPMCHKAFSWDLRGFLGFRETTEGLRGVLGGLRALWRTLKVSGVFERFQRVSGVF